MFTFYEEEDVYRGEISGILFVCQDVEDEYEEYAEELAECYKENLPEILDFMMEDIQEIYGEISPEELIQKLGRPMIDLDVQVLTYLEHTLDGEHIIEVEFDGVFEELLYFNIDG